jgi:hypothetical protein
MTYEYTTRDHEPTVAALSSYVVIRILTRAEIADFAPVRALRRDSHRRVSQGQAQASTLRCLRHINAEKR